MLGASWRATKLSPTLLRIASHRVLNSTPLARPTAKPSPSAAAAANHSWLVTSLTTLPAPRGPHSMTVPRCSSTGRAVATAAGSPPTNNVSLPLPGPVDCARHRSVDRGHAHGCSRGQFISTSSRLLVVRSTHTEPWTRARRGPPQVPAITASACGGPGRDVMKTSAPRAQSLNGRRGSSAPPSTAAASTHRHSGRRPSPDSRDAPAAGTSDRPWCPRPDESRSSVGHSVTGTPCPRCPWPQNLVAGLSRVSPARLR